MSAHLAKRREGVVALTHTEIMLVLATIILLLLLVKSNELKIKSNELSKEQSKVVALEKRANQSAEEADERKKQVDFAQEVTSKLFDSGLVEKDSSPAQRLTDLSRLIEVTEALVQAKVIDKSLDGLNDDNDKLKEKLEQMRENAAIGVAARESLGGNITNVEELKQGVRELKIGDLSRTIGCTPCWLGSGDLKYYFTYNITYSNGSYSIKPHADWGRGAEIVDDALSGELSVLRDYPRDLMTQDEFLAFGRKVDLHKNRHHNAECSLMASINEEANGEVVKFVRHEVNFCPIFR